MPVKDVQLTAIDAKRFSQRGEKMRNVRIDNNSTVTLITKSGETESEVSFRYTANYGGIGTIRIEGTLLFNGDSDKLITQWQKSGNMPNEIASEIHTAIMRVCVPEAVMVSRDIKLPPPLPLPQINIQGKKKKDADGQAGIEVA